MLKEILLNKWFFSFAVGWIVFLLLVDWRSLSKNIWGGIAASTLELWQDSFANIVGMYHMQNIGIAILNIPIFLTFGVVFTMGILFLQYVPQNPKLQLLHIVVFSIGFVTFEIILGVFDLFVKTNWNMLGSFSDNLVILGSFVWLKQYILYKSKTE